MAVINVFSKGDFLKILEKIPPKAYIVVTDTETYVWLVPTVTSHHRHYVRLDIKGNEEWKEIQKRVEERDILIIKGHVHFPKQ